MNTTTSLHVWGGWGMHFPRLSLIDIKAKWNLYPVNSSGLSQLTGQRRCCFAQIARLRFVKEIKTGCNTRQQRGQNCSGLITECHW